MIIRKGEEVSVVVPNPELPLGKVVKAYTAVREKIIREYREVYGRRAKPRAMTERINELLYFVNDNPQMAWKDLYETWNIEHPIWCYTNLHSMQNNYYRALKLKRRYYGNP